ncbi:hypothetical protein CHLNCDRAFT_57750 [Chlorella variabilis]|uniref:Uncharacterized protein n=1 Tax=Chlorella variabilis TaxID=554065 RepID=E1ZEB6_CHLVA|nr:hypothetical protein CHLNCDRAFT_57750 [Chlorella variabilis]EFN55842.1 hypothetical protein CHLNCDRAFT_57750 [Chlorella variabilis]|eukprot:XP_005847944.1 hypothetical protein CHLNCDRAFT_57750 [Chlorella variabilis]
MQFSRKSFSNLAALAAGDFGGSMGELQGGGPLSQAAVVKGSRTSMCEDDGRKTSRLIFVTNHLPLKVSKDEGSGWSFEWDPDALVLQAKEGLPDDMDAVYVGCLPVEIEGHEQEDVTQQLMSEFNCHPVFLGAELKTNFYKKFCKQQLWPILHYLIPLSPNSLGRFDPNLWSAYVRANMAFANKLVEVLGSLEDDYVWIHDYHLLVLPSLLRKRFHRIKCGIFLHSPFPSSEIFRTFPRREEVIRSMLNAGACPPSPAPLLCASYLIGFHTFDYARHFLSCCSRMLGLEHKTNRGSIIVEYYGRDVGIKIMPTGVNPERLLSGFGWSDTIWRQGELAAQFKGKTVLLGVDDMDVFKGIELKLQAFEQVLAHHPEWRGKLVLVQVTSAARAPGKDVEELQRFVLDLVESVNAKYRAPGYEPVVWLERPVPLYERIALYSIADVVVVTATRDGMNLVPYEYVVCRQGPAGGAAAGNGAAGGMGGAEAAPPDKRHSMLVVSEFVGCSPSLSGAIRVNPWSIEAVRDALYTAIRLPLVDRHIRHEKHWKYVSNHTVQFWAKAKELLDHLEGVLSNEPIEVVPGQTIVEVKPQGVSKGKMVERILHDLASQGGHTPDFVLCIGNDRSDEDMFTATDNSQFSPHMPAEVFACTVGQKPSKAPFYVNDPTDVVATLSKLAEARAAPAPASPSVSFA